MIAFNNSMASLADWLFSRKLIEFPKLKIAYSEGQIGWIPYALERADTVWEQHDSWQRSKEILPEPPSTYYYGRVYGCFTADHHGLHSLAEVGPDNICFETDYPHTDSTWPNSKEYVEKMLADFDDEVAYKVLRGNAIRDAGARPHLSRHDRRSGQPAPSGPAIACSARSPSSPAGPSNATWPLSSEHHPVGELSACVHVLLDEQQRRARVAGSPRASRYTSSTTMGARPSESSSATRSRGGCTSTRASGEHALLPARERPRELRPPFAEAGEQLVRAARAHPATPFAQLRRKVERRGSPPR